MLKWLEYINKTLGLMAKAEFFKEILKVKLELLLKTLGIDSSISIWIKIESYIWNSPLCEIINVLTQQKI